MGEHGPRLRRDNGCFIILSCELTDSVQRIKHHNRDEFNFSADFAAEQLDPFEATNVLILNTDENLFLKQRLIFIGVAGGCPSMPNSDNHVSLFSFLYGNPLWPA